MSMVPSDKNQTDEGHSKPVLYQDQQILVGQKGIFKNSKLAVIPLPIFWALVVSLIVLVGVGGTLWGQLQQKDLENAIDDQHKAALVVIRATATSETRTTATQQVLNDIATATAEMKANIAVSATVSKSETEVAATSTAEWKATSTMESITTANAQATGTAEWEATSTMESIATANTQATGTAEWEATSTTRKIAAIEAAATTTVEYIKTATAQPIATENVNATAIAERKATATAEKASTVIYEQTVTAEGIRAATAKARITSTPTPTATPIPKLNVLLLGCDTKPFYLDFFGKGEVMNTWVTVQNTGDAEATNVRISLSSQDEVSDAKPHPDKTFLIQHLPPGYETTWKLTVDTTLGQDTNAVVRVTSDQVKTIMTSKSECKHLDENAKKLIGMAGGLGKLILIKSIFK